MEEQQQELKQNNIWNAFRSVPGGIPSHIKGEYDLEKGNPVRKESIGRHRDTSLYYEATRQWDPFDILTRQYILGGSAYQLTTYVSSREITHLLIKVSLAEALIFLLLLGAIVVINRATSRWLWTPFYGTMDAVREYDIHQNRPMALSNATGIEEFDRLNQTLTALIDHVNRAYASQKHFTENASHELQTPLAIIRSKVELLVDALPLTEETAGLLADITEANERLSQMNKNLLLLTRIDNNQFPELHTIHLSDILNKWVAYYCDYYEGNALAVRTSIQPEVLLQANSSLIEILINNLLRNAFIHNIPGGHIHIRLAGDELTIENSGAILEGEAGRLFERFKKGREGSRTTGLGLALVKQICHLYRFDVQYHHREGIHCIRIAFRKEGLPNVF